MTTSRPPITVSVIVCTRNRCDKLENCLRSIDTAAAGASGAVVELLVIDNGSTDGTAALLRDIRFSPALRFTTVVEDRPGLSWARNLGLAQASGEVLVFTDDDCELSPDYIEDLIRHFETDEIDVIRGGRVELGSQADLPISTKLSPVKEHLRAEVAPGGFVLGCNMTMSRSVATRIGLFDPRFGAGAPLRSAEDTDFLIRAHLKGVVVEYVPDMVVLHHHGRSDSKQVAAINRGYDIGNGALYIKHLRTAPWLLRHFYWTLRGGLRELAGGARFDVPLNASHWPIIAMNIFGAWKYVWLSIVHPKTTTV